MTKFGYLDKNKNGMKKLRKKLNSKKLNRAKTNNKTLI